MHETTRRTAMAALLALAAVGAAAQQKPPMKIRLTVDGQSATATLYDNATARDFAALLPLDLTLTDYAAVERVATLTRKLSTQGAPEGMTPSAQPHNRSHP